MSGVRRLRGLRALIGDAVEHGSVAVEKVHVATVARTYAAVRLVSRAVGIVLDTALDLAEPPQEAPKAPEAPDDR